MADDPLTPSPTPFVGSGLHGQMTEADARALLDELARSGGTLRDFARARGFAPQRLSWWKSRFAGKHPPRASRPSHAKRSRSVPAPRFVPLVVDAPSITRRTAPSAVVVPEPRGSYELAFGGSLTLRIPHDFHEDSLTRIVRVLRDAR